MRKRQLSKVITALIISLTMYLLQISLHFDNSSNEAHKIRIQNGLTKNDFLLSEILINAPYVCHNDTYILDAVLVAPSYLYRRQVIREVWANQQTENRLKIKTVFFMGIPPSGSGQYLLEAESKKFNDIIQFNFTDTYRNLVYKSVSILSWFNVHCKSASWLIKHDADAYWNLWETSNLLKQIEKTSKEDIVCALYKNPIVCRSPRQLECSNKFVVTREEYPHDSYPSYCQGFSYIVHRKIVSSILENALRRYKKKPLFWIEDVLLTGMIAREVNASFYNIHKRLRSYPITIRPEFYDGSVLLIHDLEGSAGQGSTKKVWNWTMEYSRQQNLDKFRI